MLNVLKALPVAIVAIALAACTTPANGAAEASGTKITAAMEGQMTDDGTAIKCRSMQVTGSRFPAKECKSEKAWQEFDKIMAENAKSSTDGFQRLRSGCATQAEGTC
ncbi:MAG: hypothetical protein CVT79_11540 [Alphaproteobacteria bacterium HGW-Alphaproteobacteria-18]|nr:MAG: hypothetical protein CVT79_11540 [Alphaproteobacteria bacterium HGW-Alphaproteobacteria-18]